MIFFQQTLISHKSSSFRQRKQQQQKADQLRRSGKVTEARNALAAAAEINHDLVCGFIQVSLSLNFGIKFIISVSLKYIFF